MASDIPGETKPKLPFHKMLWKEWIKPVGSVLLVMIVVRSSVIDWNDVPSGSMLPTIQIGDRVVVNKLAYGAQIPLSGPFLDIPFTQTRLKNPLAGAPMWRWGSGPKRGDIITFWSPSPVAEKNGIRLIKRVVAIPGDSVEIKEGIVYLNDKKTSYVDATPSEPRLEKHKGIARALRDGIEEADGSPPHAVQFIDDMYSGLRNAGPFKLEADQYLCMGDDRDDSEDGRVWAKDGVFVHRRQITGRAIGTAWSLDGWSPRWNRFFKGLK